MDQETHAVMVPDSAEDGESVEDHPHGEIARGDYGY